MLKTLALSAILVMQCITAVAQSGRVLLVSSLGQVDTPCDAAVLASTSCNQMVSIRVTWKSIEPSAPHGGVHTYYWPTFLDGEIARVTKAGKQVYLRFLIEGPAAPDWIMSPAVIVVGSEPQLFVSSDGSTIWVPWDPIAQPAMQAFLSAAGARYGANTNITMVSAPGLTDNSGDWSFPHTPTDCTNWVEPVNGYTSARAIAAVQSNIDCLASAFPHAVLSLACGRNGNLDPTSNGILPTAAEVDQDYDCEQLISANITKYGARFCIQKNQLTDFCGTEGSPAGNFYILSEKYGSIQENMQFSQAVYDDPTYYDNGGNDNNGFTYPQILGTSLRHSLTWQTPNPNTGVLPVIEIYQTDVENMPTTINGYCDP